MSGRGRRAVLPPGDHRTEPSKAPDGLVVTVVNKAGHKQAYDFAGLPVAEPMQRSLAAAFAAQSRLWNSHRTAGNHWGRLLVFVRFLSGPTVDCADDTASPWPAPQGGCRADSCSAWPAATLTFIPAITRGSLICTSNCRACGPFWTTTPSTSGGAITFCGWRTCVTRSASPSGRPLKTAPTTPTGLLSSSW